jgi:hemerythrin-like domain-containing protein
MIPIDGNLPNLAQDLVRIHKVITRGLNVGVTRGKEFLADGFPSQGIQRGFADYMQSFTSVLAAHHLVEDTVAFPSLKERLVKAPYEKLAADHKKIEAALNPMRESISEVSGENPAAGLGVVVDGLRKILATWTSHIGVEETAFGFEAIARAMSPEEQANVSVTMARISQEHAGPPFLVLPFVLYNLAGVDRDAMAATLPAPVMELVMKEWKEKWSPMRPFLLD